MRAIESLKEFVTCQSVASVEQLARIPALYQVIHAVKATTVHNPFFHVLQIVYLAGWMLFRAGQVRDQLLEPEQPPDPVCNPNQFNENWEEVWRAFLPCK